MEDTVGGMKVIAFVVSVVLFVASFLMFGYAFALAEPFNLILFFAGIVAVSLSLVIPFHLLERLD